MWKTILKAICVGVQVNIILKLAKSVLLCDLHKLAVRTSDGGNGNHSVSLSIILLKIKVDRMLPSLYISSLLVSIL